MARRKISGVALLVLVCLVPLHLILEVKCSDSNGSARSGCIMSLSESLSLEPSLLRRRNRQSDSEGDPIANSEREGGCWFRNKYAILPETSLGADRYLSSLTTITDVQVSGDLQVVKVFVSVFGDERGKEVAIAGLKSKAKYVRSVLGKRMKLRLTPEIRFIEDDSFEKGSRVIAILDKIKDEKRSGSQNKEQLDSSTNEDDDDWDGEDPEEGVIYVE
ncbi:unnamed protein product [Sphenostylis stenocarpa]|uniref:Ribosome-binding factor A n=1 Tax=Sphenostylis stenocarpa TaxID=92480 RepID=A0AA86SUJ9_9FABA|nr:unnamed protein product [Sphenostylis stenocarpa]